MEIKQYINTEMIRSGLANTPQITFEVTDACNLSCVYCGYGKLYYDHDNRSDKHLKLEKARIFLEYLSKLWNSPLNKSVNSVINISFYGGEPLLNFHFVKEVIEYTKSIKGNTRKFAYSMTTNALLLNKHIDFIVSNDFRLLMRIKG